MAIDQTWWALTKTPEMKFSTKSVLCAMAIVSSEKDGKCYFWQSPVKLAEYLGCGRSTVYEQINILCELNVIQTTPDGYLLCVPKPDSTVPKPDSTVPKPDSTVPKPDSTIERGDKEDDEDIMGRGHPPGLVEKNDLRERANMIGVDPAFAADWYDRWYANGSFWVDSDMSKPLKPMGCKMGVMVNRVKAKWESERDKWMANKKRGGRATWDLKQQKENLTELMKEHPGNPKNDGIQEADAETKAAFRKLRNEREKITKQLAGVN